MNELEQFEQLFTKIYDLFDKKVGKMEDRLKKELSAKVEDHNLVEQIIHVIKTIIDIEKQQIPKEQKLEAVKLIKFQHEQIRLLDTLQIVIAKVEEKPELAGEIDKLIDQVKKSLSSEIKETQT